MSDSRITGEHVFGSIFGAESAADAPDVSVRRIADLQAQIDFLDLEMGRYRELLEKERIKHATEIADLQLKSDTRLDALRRSTRRETQSVHDTYRALLDEHQVEHEKELTRIVGEAAKELAAERERHQSILDHERTRREVQVEAVRQQVTEELNESHQNARQRLQNELDQATQTIERLEREVEQFVEQATTATMATHHAELAVTNMQRRLDEATELQHDELAKAEAERSAAIERLESERQRSAATLAELLERSASIAAEADRARSQYAAESAKAEHAKAAARAEAEAEHIAFIAAADERASRALQREAELESVIAALRKRLEP